MNDSAVILVTKQVTVKDIPLIAKYNPFIIAREPITDKGVIQAFSKDGALRGITGVDAITDLNVTIGEEPVQLKGSVPINNIISVLSGERGFTTISDEEAPADSIEESSSVNSPPLSETMSGDLLEKIELLQAAVEALTVELKRGPRQVIMKEGDARSIKECNPDVIETLETGWISNVAGG